MIECRLLGPIEITVDGRPPLPDLLWRKNLALLVYLARSPKHTRTRDHLMGLLWGEKSETSARHSLREAIRVLRRAIGDDGLTTEHDQVRLAEDTLQLDTDCFGECEAAGDWHAAARMIAGEFLEGFGVPDASPFEDWLAAERTTWRRRALAALVAGAEHALARGKSAEAAEWALRALHLEAGSDVAARAAMKALAVQGDRTGALECYERLVARLSEVEAEPEEPTRVLAERIKRERAFRLSGDVPTQPERGAESRRAPLIGRESEIERLLGTVRDGTRRRHAAVCVLLADSGLGKSRLLDELLAQTRLDGAAVASVRAVEADLPASWSGLLGLARGGLLDAAGLAAANPDALAAFTSEIPAWADRFGLPNQPPAPIGTAFSSIVRAVTDEQPAVLAIDDAQWLDRESLLALTATVRDVEDAPLTLVLSAQDEPPREELEAVRARIGRDLEGATIHLKPLDAKGLRELTRWAIPTYADDEMDRLARRVAVDSAGVPLLAVEILHAVALGMDLGTISGAWPQPYKTLDQTLPAELPDAVVAAVRVGFRRLSKVAQRVLAAAAVLGDRVETRRLAKATDVTDDELLLALDELEWQRWLVAEPRGYGFVARIVREIVARDMLTEGQRIRVLEKTKESEGRR